MPGPFMNIVIAFIFSAVIIHFCGTDPATIGRVYDSEMAKESEYADVVKEFNGVYPAEQAGIDDGDTVLEIGGSKIKNFRELQIYLEAYTGDGSPMRPQDAEEGWQGVRYDCISGEDKCRL